MTEVLTEYDAKPEKVCRCCVARGLVSALLEAFVNEAAHTVQRVDDAGMLLSILSRRLFEKRRELVPAMGDVIFPEGTIPGVVIVPVPGAVAATSTTTKETKH